MMQKSHKMKHPHTSIYFSHFKDYFPCKPGLTGYPIDSQLPLVRMVHPLTEQARLILLSII